MLSGIFKIILHRVSMEWIFEIALEEKTNFSKLLIVALCITDIGGKSVKVSERKEKAG